MGYRELLRANISAELGRAGWTRAKAAAAINLKPSSFSAKLHGRNEFKVGELIALTAALDVPFSRVIDGIENIDEFSNGPTVANL